MRVVPSSTTTSARPRRRRNWTMGLQMREFGADMHRVGIGGAASLAVFGAAGLRRTGSTGREELDVSPHEYNVPRSNAGRAETWRPWTDKAPPNSHPSEQPNDCDEFYPATDVLTLSGGVPLRVPAVLGLRRV